MAKRGESISAIKTATWTPSGGQAKSIDGKGMARLRQIALWEDTEPRDGNDMSIAEDVVGSYAWEIFLSADVVDGIMNGVTVGGIGDLALELVLIGDVNTKLTIGITKMIAGVLDQIAVPGKKGPRLLLGRNFRQTKDSVVTGPTEAA